MCWKLLVHGERSITNLRRHYNLHRPLLKRLGDTANKRTYVASLAKMWAARALRVRRQGIKGTDPNMKQCWMTKLLDDPELESEQAEQCPNKNPSLASAPPAVKLSLRSAISVGKRCQKRRLMMEATSKFQERRATDSGSSDAKTERGCQCAKDATAKLKHAPYVTKRLKIAAQKKATMTVTTKTSQAATSSASANEDVKDRN